MNIVVFLLIFIAYLVGSIPTGYWICKYLFNIDPTQNGSGNIGATNVARVLGDIRYFFLIFFLDAAKAFLMLFLATVVLQYHMMSASEIQLYLLLIAGVLVLGNTLSIFLNFRGGKGVATMFGIILYLIPLPLMLFAITCWVIILIMTKQVFMASLGAAFLLTAGYGIFFAHDVLFFFFLIACGWLIFRHKTNLIQYFKS